MSSFNSILLIHLADEILWNDINEKNCFSSAISFSPPFSEILLEEKKRLLIVL